MTRNALPFHIIPGILTHADATRLQARLLGEFALIEDGQRRLVQVSDSARSLVAYLLLHRESAHPRQQLAYRLWPESGDAQAQSNLRALLVRLRKAWPGVDRYVAIDQRLIGWRMHADVQFDVAEFEAALQENGDRVAALERAVELYRGDLYPQCYADWIVPEQDRLRLRFLKALDELVDVLAASGNANQAIGFAQRRLRADPLDEAAYQALMRLHALRVDRVDRLPGRDSRRARGGCIGDPLLGRLCADRARCRDPAGSRGRQWRDPGGIHHLPGPWHLSHEPVGSRDTLLRDVRHHGSRRGGAGHSCLDPRFTAG